MAYTKVSQLTLLGGFTHGEVDIETEPFYTVEQLGVPSGNFDPAQTHYYGEDIRKVMLGANG